MAASGVTRTSRVSSRRLYQPSVYRAASAGIVPRRTSMPIQATTRAAAELSRPSSSVSVTSWRTSRIRPAPSAARMASSRRRSIARASSRPTRFAHATSSTRLAPAWRMPTTAGVMASRNASESDSTAITRSRFARGYSSDRRPATASISARACRSETPAASLPMTVIVRSSRSAARCGVNVSGAQISQATGNSNAGGAIPPTTCASSFSQISRPMMAGSPQTAASRARRSR